MQLDKYKGVIRRAYDQTTGRDFEEFWASMMQKLEIAADLMGDIELQAPPPIRQAVPVSIETLRKAQPALAQPAPITGAIILSAAPPVAGADTSEDAPEDDVDYYESKPGKGDGAERLQQKLLSMMPKSITVQLPGFDEPLILNCGVGSPGLRFCHVNYTLQGSQEMGPRVTIMTSQKDIVPDLILKDIVAQAQAMYSKEKRVLQARTPAPQPPPSSQDLQNMLARDRANQPPVSHEDVELQKEWASSRSPRWQ